MRNYLIRMEFLVYGFGVLLVIGIVVSIQDWRKKRKIKVDPLLYGAPEQQSESDRDAIRAHSHFGDHGL